MDWTGNQKIKPVTFKCDLDLEPTSLVMGSARRHNEPTS